MRTTFTTAVVPLVGVLAALGACACCGGPPLLRLAGWKLPWMAQAIAQLHDYHLAFVTVAAAAFGWALYRLHAVPLLLDADHYPGAGLKLRRTMFWLASGTSLSVILLPLYAPVP